jgi:hypothetical protein
MNLYIKMGEELRDLFKDLFVPERAQAACQKMAGILSTAKQIGGSIGKEAEELNREVLDFLKHPADRKRGAALKKLALRLEQETREL